MEVALEQHHIQLLLIKSLRVEDILLWICACKTNLSMWSDIKLLGELCKEWKIDMSCESIRHLHYIYSKVYFTSLTPLIIRNKAVWKPLIERSHKENRLSDDNAELLSSKMGIEIVGLDSIPVEPKRKSNMHDLIEENDADKFFSNLRKDPRAYIGIYEYIHVATKNNKHNVLLQILSEFCVIDITEHITYAYYADEYTLRIMLAVWDKCGEDYKYLIRMIELIIIYNKHRHFEILLRFMIPRYYETWKLLIKWLLLSVDNLSIECVKVIFKIISEKVPIYNGIYFYLLDKTNVEELKMCRRYTKFMLEHYK